MNDVINKINGARSVAVLGHVNEDADAIGSCLAFAKILRKMGKKAAIYVSGKIEERLAFIGTDYVVYNKDIRHDHDLCVCLDCGDIDRITERKELFSQIGNSVNIDHHLTNTHFADANYVDGKAAATGEILTELFYKMGAEIDNDIAACLYAAICSDTGCFKYSSVTSKTLRIAADLIGYDFDHAEIARLLFDTESLAETKLKAEIMGGIESFADGKISFVSVSESIADKYGIDRTDIPNLVEIPRRVEGTEIAVCIKHVDDVFRINLRSNGKADVAKVASALGGGGHIKAAGATIRCASEAEAKNLVISKCIEALGA